MIAWLLLTATVGAAAPSDPVIDALVEEMDRNLAGLSLPNAPPIYHLRYHLVRMGQVDVRASMGALVSESTDAYHGLGIELRVGSPSYDNTGFGGWQNGFGGTGLPEALTPEAVRLAAWRLTDAAYKQAVEQYARKRAQFPAPEDHPGDYTLTGPTVVDLGAAQVADATVLRDLALRVSAAMADVEGLLRADVFLGHEAGDWLVVDSEGSRVRRPASETTVRAVAHVRAPDGMLLTDQVLWTVKDAADLPPLEEMTDRARRTAEGLVALSRAPTLTDEYVGPVIFEGEAAADLFRWLLVPQLEGTPAEVPFESLFGRLGSGSPDAIRLERRVLPIGWTVVDDPRDDERHPAAFEVDMEGVPSRKVELVTDGIVRTLLMSRVPRKGLEETNGHARGTLGQRPSGRATLLEVEPDRRAKPGRVHRRAKRLASSYGRDHVLVVRRLQEPSARGIGEQSAVFFLGDDTSAEALPEPVDVVRRYSDGREERLRGVRFSSVQRFVLRDVVAAGAQVETTFMAPFQPGGFAGMGPTEGMPTRVRAPEVLIGEMELVPVPGDPRERPVIPPPRAARR